MEPVELRGALFGQAPGPPGGDGGDGDGGDGGGGFAREADIDRAELLRRMPLFAGLDDGSVEELVGVARVTRFPADAEMVEEGAEFVPDYDGMYLLVQGTAEVRKASARGERTVARLGAGDIFGELSMLDGQPRSASVVAVTDCLCLIVDQWDFLRVARRRPEIAERMMVELAGRLRGALAGEVSAL